MVKNTADFSSLSLRLNDLLKFLPPAPAAPNYSHSSTDFDQMSAFVVLTHAACEEFMEIRALHIAKQAKDAFDQNGWLGRVGKHLCVFPFISVPNDASEFEKMRKVVGLSGFGILATPVCVASNKKEIKSLLDLGFKRYSKAVKDNHGASLKYQFKLLALLGCDLGVLGATFDSRIAQLADYRGKAAHAQIVAVNVTHTSTTLATWPADLLGGYQRLDLELQALAKRKV